MIRHVNIGMHGMNVGMRRHMLDSEISMLRLPVSPQVHLPLEGAATQVAREGFEAGVFA